MDPVTAGLDLGKSITGLISEWVEDKDLANKLNFEIIKMQNDFNLAMLQSKTNPKMDALVKFMFALKNVIIPLLRPICSFLITAFGMYCHYKGIQVDPTTHAILDAAFPGWMTSRHIDKSNQAKIKAKAVAKKGSVVWDDEETDF